jgi:hypothetical protein
MKVIGNVAFPTSKSQVLNLTFEVRMFSSVVLLQFGCHNKRRAILLFCRLFFVLLLLSDISGLLYKQSYNYSTVRVILETPKTIQDGIDGEHCSEISPHNRVFTHFAFLYSHLDIDIWD